MKLVKVSGAVIILLALVALLSFIPALMSLSNQPSRHAENKHNWDATEIVECITKNGTYYNMIFRSKDGKFFLPCQLSDGRIGLGIFDKDGNNISAYVPGDGVWEHVRDYILQRAFRFTGPLPW